MKSFLKRLKGSSGWILIVILCAIPLVLWARISPMAIRFGSLYATVISLGQLTGLVGAALFALSLILSGRFRWTEGLFGGMNRVYIAHHIIGGIGFILLMVHPLILLYTRAMISFNKAALFFVPGQNASDTFGILSLLSLMVLLIATYYVKLHYHIWKLLHKFLGASFFLGFLHMFLTQSDVARDTPMRMYMLGISTIALLVYVYRTILGRWLVRKCQCSVTSITPLSGEMVQIALQPQGHLSACEPGQFVFLSFNSNAFSPEWHPFSISSINPDGTIEVIIKQLGDYTKHVHEICLGMNAWIEGPYGRFYHNVRVPKQIWIAGGVGVTPFLSMAKRLNTDTLVDLYYVVHDQQEAVGANLLHELVQSHANFRVCIYDTSAQKTRITAQMIQETSGDLAGRDIYICGPPPMMKSLRSQLQALHVFGDHIHTEEFSMS